MSHSINTKSLISVFGGLKIGVLILRDFHLCWQDIQKVHIPSFNATFRPCKLWCHALSTAVVIYPPPLCHPCTPTELSLKLENPVPQETNMWSVVAWSSLKSTSRTSDKESQYRLFFFVCASFPQEWAKGRVRHESLLVRHALGDRSPYGRPVKRHLLEHWY